MENKFIDDLEKFISKHPYYKKHGVSLNRTSVYGLMGQMKVEFNDQNEIKNNLLIQY